MYLDRRLRTLQRLAERCEGEQLERVLEMIAQRRRELERAEDRESEIWDVAERAAEGTPWTPGAKRFAPAAPDSVPIKVRRPGERGYRIVGVRKTRRPDPA